MRQLTVGKVFSVHQEDVFFDGPGLSAIEIAVANNQLTVLATDDNFLELKMDKFIKNNNEKL